MDSISQAALGAAIGEAVLGKKIGNKAYLLGALAGTIPDLDVLLVPFFNDLQKISLHRGYSHSIIFCIGGAFLLAYILQRIKWTKEIAYGRLWLFSFLGLFTHVMLDAFTSYGTQLFLPLTDYRVSFDSISIVDPFYTIPLLVGLAGAFFKDKQARKRRLWNYCGLILSSVYLLFTLANKQSVNSVFNKSLENQGIVYQKMLSVPVSLGNVLWYGVARTDKGLYIGNYSLFDKDKDISFEFFPTNENLLNGLDPELVDRMKWFAQGFYTVAEKDNKIHIYNLQCDMQGTRYGDYKAPTSFYFEIEPLPDGSYDLSSGMHQSDQGLNDKLNRILGEK